MTKQLRHTILFCVAMLFAACTTDNNAPDSLMSVEYSSMPIAFVADDSNAKDVLTRGTQTDTEVLKEQSFAVNARYYNTGATYGRDFFDGQQIRWESSQWTYSPVKYWPTTGELDFYAYSPTQDQMKGTFESLNMQHNEAYVWLMHYNVATPIITSITELSGSTIPTETFQKAKDADNQQDLLLATNVNNLCSDERGINSKVSIHFKHALAGLAFQLADDYNLPDDATHIILSIAPMCSGGTITMDASNQITWTIDESEATYYQAYEIEGKQLKNYQEKIFFLPPQTLKNFTVTARFYKQTGGDYTLIDTRISNRNKIALKQGTTQTINLTN